MNKQKNNNIEKKSIFNLSNKVKSDLGSKEKSIVGTSHYWNVPESEMLLDSGKKWRFKKRNMFMRFYILPLIDSGKLMADSEIDKLVRNFLLDFFTFFKVHTLKEADFFYSRNEIKDKKIKSFLKKINSILEESNLTISDCKLQIK